jgi:hypothetical protein
MFKASNWTASSYTPCVHKLMVCHPYSCHYTTRSNMVRPQATNSTSNPICNLIIIMSQDYDNGVSKFCFTLVFSRVSKKKS